MNEPENNDAPVPFNPESPEDRAKMSKAFQGAEHLPLDVEGIYEGAEAVLMGEVTLTDVEIFKEHFLLKLRPLAPAPGTDAPDWSKFVFIATLKRPVAVRLRAQIHAAILNLDPKFRARTERELLSHGAVVGREQRADHEERAKDALHSPDFQNATYLSLEDAMRSGQVQTLDGQMLTLPQASKEAADLGGVVTDQGDPGGDDRGGEQGGLLERVFDVAKDAAAAAVAVASSALRGQR